MLCVYLLLGVATLVAVGCDPAEPVANVDSQARKVVTFEGGDVTQGELDEFAEQSGVPKDDPQYQATVQQILPQLVNVEVAKAYAYEQALKQNNITEDQLREDIRENLPVQEVQERVTGAAEPSNREIQNYYEKNKEAQFTTPEQRC